MKKIYLLPLLLSIFASTAFATSTALEQINMNIQNVLAPFQNSTTLAKVNFNNLKMSKDQVLKISLNGHAQKIGANNIVDLKIKNLEYNFNNGISPQILFSGSFGFDFTKIKNTQEINDVIEDAIQELKTKPSTPYGDALKVKSTISAIEKDDNGNKIGLTAIISAKIDFNKLPNDTSKEDVEFKNMTFAISLNAKKSSELHGFININPDSTYCKEGQQKLQQMLEMLIDNDERLIGLLSYIAMQADASATELLNSNYFNKNLFKHLIQGVKF